MNSNNNKQFDRNVNEINPHMPQYIVKAPWYCNQTENSLNHQKTHNVTSKVPISQYTQKGLINEEIYKFRKGACDNCGSSTHKAKDCCERPRKRGAKFTNQNFRPDEYIKEVNLDYEGKRDRWNGYHPDMAKRLMHEYKVLEEEKKKIVDEKIANAKTDKEKKKLQRDEDLEEDISSDEENDIPDIFKKVVEQIQTNEEQQQLSSEVTNEEINDEGVIQYFADYKSKNNNELPKDINLIPKKILFQISTSKSLHIGEDYSKYLLNLALNSAYYDAKSRSMRENPLATTGINTFKGENSLRQTGDALKLIEMENFVQAANSKNKDLNLNNIAMPTQAELFSKLIKEKKENHKTEKLKKTIEKYGGEDHFKVPDSIITSSKYDEVDESSTILNINQGIKSSYEEDVYVNNHTSIWGSYYNDSYGWGYKCCLTFIKDSLCGGDLVKRANMIKMNEADNQKISQKNKQIETEHQHHNLMKEQLNKLNDQESQSNAFSQIFDSMEHYESTGQFLGNKVERSSLL